MYHHDQRRADHARDWCNITNKYEIEPLVECRIDRIHRAGQEQRVPVRTRLHDRLGSAIDAPAGPVFDDELPAESLRQPWPNEASRNILAATRCRADE